MITPTENVVAELRRAVMNGEDGCGTLPAKESVKVRPQDWHRITRLAREAAALIESQRATIERVERERDIARTEADFMRETSIKNAQDRNAAEARVTALEAEKAGLVKALTDPVVVHRNMLAGSIAKPSTMNIAHLYPEVQQMRQALIATLKHFRHPTSAEHATLDKVMAALSHFDDPPLTPMFQALSRSTEKNDG